MAKLVVIGAGISGLSCAFRLKQLGMPCLLLEASARPGGVIATTHRNGCLVELGPQSPRFSPSIRRLLSDLGIEHEFIAGNPKAKRYILREGRLRRVPFGPIEFLTSDLVGPATKFRLVKEAFTSTSPPTEEETLATFVSRKFGDEILQNLVDPIISTVFFADAYKMGMQSAFPALVEWERNHGSVVRGAFRARSKNNNSMKVTDSLPSLGSLQSGMSRLPERMAQELRDEIHYGETVQSMSLRRAEVEGRARWVIRLASGAQCEAEHVVVALPAHEAAKTLESSLPALAGHLRGIEYASMCGVSNVYERKDVRNALDGFGFMVPRNEGLRTICTFWNSSQFPNRAPQDKVLVTNFVRSEPDAAPGEHVIMRAVASENAAVLGIAGEPLAQFYWEQPQALPQYNLGHRDRISAIEQELLGAPGLHLTGNYFRGRAIGDCADLAFHVAETLHSRLRENDI
jgi:protoporphyrinogen/coproporphyrinogen III oxidase